MLLLRLKQCLQPSEVFFRRINVSLFYQFRRPRMADSRKFLQSHLLPRSLMLYQSQRHVKVICCRSWCNNWCLVTAICNGAGKSRLCIDVKKAFCLLSARHLRWTKQWVASACQSSQKLNKKLGYRRDSAHRRSLCRSRSFKVIGVGTSRKPACNLLFVVNNANIHAISHHFPIIAQYLSNYRR